MLVLSIKKSGASFSGYWTPVLAYPEFTISHLYYIFQYQITEIIKFFQNFYKKFFASLFFKI